MRVEVGRLIRNASGDFGCPNCWVEKGGHVNPAHKSCPTCGEPLEFSEEAVQAAAYWQHRRRVERGEA